MQVVNMADPKYAIILNEDVLGSMSVRAQEWMHFALQVLDHIENYTVPQYGDYPNDQLTEFAVQDIKAQLVRYINRIGSNARGKEEALRDMLKVSHYASAAYHKMKNEEGKNVICIDSGTEK